MKSDRRKQKNIIYSTDDANLENIAYCVSYRGFPALSQIEFPHVSETVLENYKLPSSMPTLLLSWNNSTGCKYLAARQSRKGKKDAESNIVTNSRKSHQPWSSVLYQPMELRRWHKRPGT